MKIVKSALMLTGVLCIGASLIYANEARKDTSAEALKVMSAAEKYNKARTFEAPQPFVIENTGTDKWIDYTKYGEFQGVGTENYKYVVKDMPGLRKASGAGIYPNQRSVYGESGYKHYVDKKKLEGDKWAFVNTNDFQGNFYKWATAQENPGIKLYYTAFALDKAGNVEHAIKAYYACLVFFPKTIGLTQGVFHCLHGQN